MSLIDIFRGNTREKPSPPNIPVDMAESGERIWSDDIVSSIKEELERRRGERSSLELQWALNANFLAGHQNCDINVNRRCIVDEESTDRIDRERRVFNRIAPLMETRHANLGSVKYDMVVNPRSPEASDAEKAKISTKLLEYCQSQTDFKSKADEMISWAELCGTAFTLSWWDVDAGETVGRGEEVRVNADGDVKRADKTYTAGNVAFGLISAYEVFPHSLVIQEIENQHDIILEQVYDVGKIFDIYGKKFDGEDVESYVLTPIPNAVGGHGQSNASFGVTKETRPNCERVITYLENPSAEYPAGRYITIIKDEIVYYGTLPGGIMPLVAVKSKPVVGQFFAKSVIQDLIPYQRVYNNVCNKINEFIDTVSNNSWLVPRGSLNVDSIEATGIEAGSIIEYDPAYGVPSLLEYPSPPTILQNQRAQLASDMEYVAGVSQLMVVGAAPSGVTSGTAIDNLRQIDATRMSLTADSIRSAVCKMAEIWLALNKHYSQGYRVLLICGKDDIGAAYTWCAEDINSFDVSFAAENELRHSKDAQRQDFVQAFNMGLLMGANGQIEEQYKERGRELFDLPETQAAYTVDDLQRKNAKRENAYLEGGVIPQRYKYDDDEIHLAEHMKYALSEEFRELRKRFPSYTEAFDNHINEHKEQIAAKEAAERQAALAAQMQAQTQGG